MDLPLKSDLIFDIGAHIGSDSDFYLSKGYRVVAVEADPDHAEACRKRFSDHVTSGDFVVEEGAITDDPDATSVTFYSAPDHKSEWGTIDADMVRRNAHTHDVEVSEVTVKALSPAALFQQHGVPHYVKIDIEGVDRALLDAVAALDTKPQFLSIESDKNNYETVCDELRRMEAMGYKRFAVIQQAGLGLSTIHTKKRDGSDLTYQFPQATSGPFGDDIAPEAWVSREEAEKQYRRVFREYHWFGDDRPRIVRRIGILIGRLRGAALPGWYDTHARLD